MADDRAQLYTIEGLTAGLIMIATAYFVLNTGFMYAPGDAHIADMQLEQIGTDALLMMDTPVNDSVGSELEGYVNDGTGQWDSFNTTLNNYLRMNTGATSMVNNIRYNASIYYRKSSTDEVGAFEFGHFGDLVAHEPAVSVSRLVYCDNNPPSAPYDHSPQELIFEVILWRG